MNIYHIFSLSALKSNLKSNRKNVMSAIIGTDHLNLLGVRGRFGFTRLLGGDLLRSLNFFSRSNGSWINFFPAAAAAAAAERKEMKKNREKRRKKNL